MKHLSRTRRLFAAGLTGLLAVGTVPLLAGSAAADITNVSPTFGTPNDAALVVTVTGNGNPPFAATDILRLKKTGPPTDTVSCTTDPQGTSTTSLKATCNLTAATPGSYDVVVDRLPHDPTPNDQTPSQIPVNGPEDDVRPNGFTVFGGSPVIASFTPAQRARGTSVAAALTGSNFSRNMTVSFLGPDGSVDPGVTFSYTQSSTNPTTTRVDGTLSVSSTALLGPHTVRVTTADGGTGERANALTITERPVARSEDVDPSVNNQASLGQNATNKLVTINGQFFQPGITLTESPDYAGLSFSGLTYVSSTKLTVLGTVTDTAAPGTANIVLANPDGGTTSFPMSVSPKPNVTAASPTSRGSGSGQQQVTLTGTGFWSVAGKQTQFAFDPSSGITILSSTVENMPVSCTTTCTQATLLVEIAPNATSGNRTVVATNYDGGTSRGAALQITSAPTVSSVSPASRARGFTGNVTVNGTNFNNNGGAPNVSFGSGITVNSVTYLNSGQLSVNITVDNEALQGPRNVTVTNRDGGSGTCTGCFSVEALAVTGSTPTGALNGSSRTISVFGSGFATSGTPTVALVPVNLPAGQPTITATDVVVAPNGQSLTGTFDLSTAAPGRYTIRVTNPNGDTGSCTSCFKVVTSTPTLTSVSPNKAVQGQQDRSLTLSGTNFSNGMTVAFSGAGITVDSVSVTSPTSATVVVDLAPSAAIGKRNVTVTVTDPEESSPRTGTCTECFEVTQAPTVTSTTPNNLGRGATNRNVDVLGTGFQPGATVSFGDGITVNGTPTVTATKITANISVADDAATGARGVTVTNPDGGQASCTGCFTVNPKPTVSSVSPTSGQVGQTIPVTITGTGFQPGTPTVTAGEGITVTNATRTSDTTITASFAISGAATPGARDVSVSTTDGGTGGCTNCFSVISAPTVTGITPSSAPQGSTTQNVTITGTGFGPVGGTPDVSFSGTGVSASGGTIASSTSITGLTVTVSPSAAGGARNVTVTNSDGGAGTCTSCFTVEPGPTVTGANPSSVNRGRSGVSVVVSGTDFAADSTVSFGPGVTVASVTRDVSGSADTITAIVSVASDAALGARTITVSNPTAGSSGVCVDCFAVVAGRALVVEVIDTKGTSDTADDAVTTNPMSGTAYTVRVTGKTGDSSSATDTGWSSTPTLTSSDSVFDDGACGAASAGVATCTSVRFGDLGAQTLTAKGSGGDGDRSGLRSVTVVPNGLEFTAAPTSAATGDQLTYTVRPKVGLANAKRDGYTATRTLVVGGTGSSLATGSTLSCSSPTCSFTLSFSEPGQKSVRVRDNSTPQQTTPTVNVSVVSVGTFVPLSPARLLDTRPQYSDSDGFSSKVRARQTITLQVSGRGGVPAGASAVAVNVGITNAEGTSVLTVYPANASRPLASTMNFVKGETVANMAVVKLSDTGRIAIYQGFAASDVFMDVVGYYTGAPAAQGGRLIAVNPARVQQPTTMATGQTRTLSVTGANGVPAASDVSGVVVSVTARNTNGGTYLTLYPGNESRPVASNLNAAANRTVGNLAMVKVSPTGTINLFNLRGPTTVSVDVLGYYTKTTATDAGRFFSLVPARLLDTRQASSPTGGQRLAAASPLRLKVTDRPLAGVPATGVSSVILNVTVTGGTTSGQLTVYPDEISKPGTGNTAYLANQQTANLVVAKVDDDGEIRIATNQGAVHVVIDVVGYLTD
jgi:hypothetical protein